MNLSQVGNQEDSSSEDTSSNGNCGKPALPPRPRSISIDHSATRLEIVDRFLNLRMYDTYIQPTKSLI